VSISKYKFVVVYILYGIYICVQHASSILCDPNVSCPVNMLAMLIVEKRIYININGCVGCKNKHCINNIKFSLSL
jgi:hypothetical protein